MILWLILCLLLATVPGMAHATTHYVHGTSGNDSNSCSTATSSTPSNAKQSIGAGLSCTSGGDELIVRGGTGGSCIVYPEGNFLPPSGSAGGYTNIHVPNGECAHVVSNVSVDQMVFFENRSYVIWDGFKMDGGAGGGDINNMTSHTVRHAAYIVYTGSNDNTHHIIIRNNELLRSRHSCQLGEGNNLEFSNNVVHHCGWFCCNSNGFIDPETGDTSNGDDHGFYFEAHNSLIRGNTFHHNPAYGIQIYGTTIDSDKSNNIVENNSFSTSRCGYTMQGDNNIFRNNIMFNDGHNEDLGAFSGTGCGGGAPASASGVITGGNGQDAINNTLYGHTIYDNGHCGSGCEIKNNIVCNGGTIQVEGSAGHSNDLTGACPGFVNAGGGNFRLTSDDTGGVTSSNALIDADGHTRRTPNSSRGAYDFAGPVGPPVATGLRFLIQPSTAAVNTAITPAVQVDIIDQTGAHMSTASATITLTLSTGTATLANAGPIATVSGTATFPALALNAAGSGYVLTATAAGGGLASATSVPFTITGVPTACTSPCTIYVNPATGDDSRACNAVTLGNARQTLAGGLACMTVGGSTLSLRAGTYNACIDTSITPIASGSTGAPTTIAAYASEAVTLAPTAPTSSACQAVVFLRNNDHDMVLSGLTLDAGNRTDSNGLVFYPGTHHVRFQDGIVRNTFYEGVFISNASDTAVVGSTIDQSAFYGINVAGSSTRTLLDNLVVRNHANQGILIINGSIFTINRVTATSNGISGTLPAIRVGGTGNSGSIIANSVVNGNYAGIDVTSGASGLKVYNNTVVSNTGAGVSISAGATGTLLTNTIMTGNNPGQDLVNNAGLSTVQTTLLFTNPGFDGGASCPYCLTPAATTAVNVGTSLAADVPLDRAGVTRPQGGVFDIGAYECPDPCTGVAPPPTGVQLKTPAWQTGGLYRK